MVYTSILLTFSLLKRESKQREKNSLSRFSIAIFVKFKGLFAEKRK